MQLRDSLVRGLGVSEQIHTIIDTTTSCSESEQSRAISRCLPHRPDSSASIAGSRPRSVFFTHTVYHDSSMGTSFSRPSLPAEHSNPFMAETTPQLALPGYTSMQPHRRLSAQRRSNAMAVAHSSLPGYRNGPPGGESIRHLFSRPQKHPQHHFGLSITSAPIKLNSRKRQPLVLPSTRHLGATNTVRYEPSQ